MFGKKPEEGLEELRRDRGAEDAKPKRNIPARLLLIVIIIAIAYFAYISYFR